MITWINQLFKKVSLKKIEEFERMIIEWLSEYH